jgi:hypothetical protein
MHEGAGHAHLKRQRLGGEEKGGEGGGVVDSGFELLGPLVICDETKNKQKTLEILRKSEKSRSLSYIKFIIKPSFSYFIC